LDEGSSDSELVRMNELYNSHDFHFITANHGGGIVESRAAKSCQDIGELMLSR